MSPVRIATRGSELALWQAHRIGGLVEERLGRKYELVPIRTTGDRLQNLSFASLKGRAAQSSEGGLKGLFIKEIEEALLDGRADLAVHSAKDLPAELAPDLALAAFPERADARDALVGAAPGATLESLASGARIGTGSVRRAAQLRARRPDLEIEPLRGNVPTRLAKLETEGLDAVVLACAGLDRLGLGNRIGERLAPGLVLPAVAQGILAVQTRVGDALESELANLDDAETRRAALAERAFLAGLGGDCTTPLGALATPTADGGLSLDALLASPDGKTIVRREREGTDPEALGRAIAAEVLEAGGRELLCLAG